MGQRGLKWAAAIAACLCLGGVSYGADEDMKALMERVKALEAKNSALESKLDRTTSSRSEIDRAMARADASLGSVVTNADPHGRPLRIGGYLDASYQFNINRPDNQNNNYRAYDRDSNGFNIHTAEIDFERLPTKSGEAGFRVDLAFGTDSNKLVGLTNTPNSPDSLFDLQQAFISYIAPLGNGLTIDVGKFVTANGAEVIEAADNMNSSRSLLFTYAIPATHTGARISYPVIKDKWTLGMTVANGWDNNQDQNDGKFVELNSKLTINEKFTWVLNASVGNENTANEVALFANSIGPVNAGDPTDPTTPGFGSTFAGKAYDQGDSSDPRGLIDWTLTFKPVKKLELALNGDIGFESAQTWWGGAFYVKYQINKDWYIADRIEYFSDKHGARTGFRQTLWENTITLDWALSDPLHMRFEYRHDESNIDAFSNTKGIGDTGPVNTNTGFRQDWQDTVMVQWLYKF